jgi:hypothetical protein
MKKTNLLLISLLGLLLTMTMCKKDDDDPPYVGSWETDVFTMQEAQVKMDFDFTASNFTGAIRVFITNGVYIDYLGIKGDVTETDNQNLDISLTDLGLYDGDIEDYDYKNRVNDATEFDALYTQYLATSLPKDFLATYEITGDQMDLVIADIQETITLYRK